MVEDLLELARADSGQSRENISQLDFSKLVSDCVLPFEPVYYEKGLALETEVEPGISLEGRQQQLRQLTDILLDNAGKYSLPGGPVTLRLSRQGGRHCLLSVSNPAQEMSREECRDIFKRFYRADKARSRDGSYGPGPVHSREHSGSPRREDKLRIRPGEGQLQCGAAFEAAGHSGKN